MSRIMPLQHEQIKRTIKQRIGREWKPGDRLPPINLLANELGVGENSAYRAVRELCDEGVLASRPRRGTIVTARPKDQPTKPAVCKRVHLPLGADRDGMIQRMARSTVEELRRRGREVTMGPNVRTLEGVIDLRGVEADAVVLFNEGPTDVRCDDGMIFSLIDTSAAIPARITRRYDMVSPDNEQGGCLAGEYVKLFGMTDAAFVGVRDKGGGYCPVDAARLAGFERGFGHSLPKHRRMYVDHYSWNEGARFARDYAALSSKPDTLFFATDDIAIGFTVGGAVLDLEPRRDYHLIGFDGQSLARNGTFGGITTVAVAAESMGIQAAELLDIRLDHPDLPPRSMSLGCAVRRGKTMPKPAGPQHPFFTTKGQYWPTPLDSNTP